MNFDRGRNLAKLLIIMCVVFCVLGVITNGESVSAYFTIISFVCFVVSFVVLKLYCRCPYCGKTIFVGLFNATECPHCRRNLTTGKRKKGKGGKR